MNLQWMFIAAALFIITKKLKQPNCQSINPWITRNVVYLYNKNYAYVETERKKKKKGQNVFNWWILVLGHTANSFNYSCSIFVCLEVHQNKKMKENAHCKKLWIGIDIGNLTQPHLTWYHSKRSNIFDTKYTFYKVY